MVGVEVVEGVSPTMDTTMVVIEVAKEMGTEVDMVMGLVVTTTVVGMWEFVTAVTGVAMGRPIKGIT